MTMTTAKAVKSGWSRLQAGCHFGFIQAPLPPLQLFQILPWLFIYFFSFHFMADSICGPSAVQRSISMRISGIQFCVGNLCAHIFRTCHSLTRSYAAYMHASVLLLLLLLDSSLGASHTNVEPFLASPLIPSNQTEKSGKVKRATGKHCQNGTRSRNFGLFFNLQHTTTFPRSRRHQPFILQTEDRLSNMHSHFSEWLILSVFYLLVAMYALGSNILQHILPLRFEF